MNTPHTPGPWHVEHPFGEKGTYISSPDTTLVAKVYNERDAKLLAAAEEMLKALSIAATTLETVYRERDPKNIAAKMAAKMAREAIAKALPEQPSTKNNEPSTSP